MNLSVHVFWIKIFEFFRWILKIGITGSHCYTFESYKLFLQSGFTMFCPTYSGGHISASTYWLQHLSYRSFVDIKWYTTVILIYISIIISTNEHFSFAYCSFCVFWPQPVVLRVTHDFAQELLLAGLRYHYFVQGSKPYWSLTR